MTHKIKIYLSLLLLFVFLQSWSQQGLDNPTRALFIMDIAKYVDWPPEQMINAEEFSIAVLSSESELYWDLENLAKTRKFVQGIPVRIYLFRDLDKIINTNVLYVNKGDEYKIKDVLNKTKGTTTLIMSEGYDFRESMINFLVMEGKPQFEVNEELMNSEGLSVSKLFLTLAVKTREDWESLFSITDEKLQEEIEITRQQKLLIAEQQTHIEDQRKMISVQLARLDSLDIEIKQKQSNIITQQSVLVHQRNEITIQKSQFKKQEAELAVQVALLVEKQNILTANELKLNAQSAEIQNQDAKIMDQFRQIKKQNLILVFVIIALFLVSGLGYFIYMNYRNKKKANKILENKNKLITEQKEEIHKQKDIAEMQRDQIAYQKKHITDSIEYAKKIQAAILPSLELFSDKIEHFVLYKPRDIVSGDFYWVNKIGNKQIIITADCTGHGVPGAFMSMLGISLINEIVNNKGIHKPDEILNELRKSIIASLRQFDHDSVIKDGMDMTVCTIHYDRNILEFAGANNPLMVISNGDTRLFKGDKMPVAIYDDLRPFTLHEIKLNKGDCFYTYSDGYVDQFGGPNQKKLLTKNFRELVEKIHLRKMIDQGTTLSEFFDKWREDVDQIDDVTVIGVRY